MVLNVPVSLARLTVLAFVLLATACTAVPAANAPISQEAVISKATRTQIELRALPGPSAKIPVAVYGFDDKTGQFRPTETGQTLSRAVSQGADSILIKALQDAGDRTWFTVVERSSLNNLLKERQIIAEMRQRYLGESGINPQALPPLLFAGVLLEGGIVGFDTNTLTGGAAARYLGVGGQTTYRQNVVSVYLRAVSVKTGEVLASVTTEKTIASIAVAGNAFRFVSFDDLLEADVGITSNEPGLFALRQAIEKSVYALILEGADIGIWGFGSEALAMPHLDNYRAERDGVFDLAKSKSNAGLAARSPENGVPPTLIESLGAFLAPNNPALRDAGAMTYDNNTARLTATSAETELDRQDEEEFAPGENPTEITPDSQNVQEMYLLGAGGR